MRKFGKWLGRAIFTLFLFGVGAWAFAPEEPVDREISFDPNSLGEDLDAYLKTSEQRFSDIVAKAEKRIVWAGAKNMKTPFAVIYIHGFSATAEEIRPVPDQVARALGANLYFTRLAGHGRGGAAMAEPRAGDWLEDMAEAIAIGRRLGDRVMVISTSTGGTLAALAATDPTLAEGIAGIVMVSPNFGVKALAGKILDLPFARNWGPLVAGETRSFEPVNEGQAKYWTTSYPTVALFPMAALVRAARAADMATAKVPLLVIYSEQDQVVDPAKTLDTLSGWGGSTRYEPREMGPGDDSFSHVIAGDILSPGQTQATTDLILDWAKGL